MISTAPATPPRRSGLSKSRIAVFEQCPKRLWLSVHRAGLAQESDSTKRVFRVGHAVGEAACAQYPGGIEIDAGLGLAHAAEATATAMLGPIRVPLFEATFIHEGVVVRVDLLLPDCAGWHVVEVKSTTSVKPYQRADLATQLWVLSGCGVRVSRASVRVIDRTFMLREPGDYDGLFADVQADEVVEALVANRGMVVSAAAATLAGPEPEVATGAHCSNPFQCSFIALCQRDIPAQPVWPVSLLPGSGGRAVARQLVVRGIDDLLAADATEITAPLLQRVHAATVSGVAWHDAAAICSETSGWAYPRTFLDFESIAFAVPRWVGTSPYQQVPFQFSAHLDHGTGDLEHTAYLSLDGSDPRDACARALASLPNTGAVIAWNASFERGCLLQLADAIPVYGPALRALAARLVDLLPVARRHYYHRDMRGSWSIKAVLPTLAPELDYGSLNGARSGEEAQDHYLEAIDSLTSNQRWAELRQGLLNYCARDTFAMVVLLARLTAAEPRATSSGSTVSR